MRRQVLIGALAWILTGCLKPLPGADDFPAPAPTCASAMDCGETAGPCVIPACVDGGCTVRPRLWQAPIARARPASRVQIAAAQDGGVWVATAHTTQGQLEAGVVLTRHWSDGEEALRVELDELASADELALATDPAGGVWLASSLSTGGPASPPGATLVRLAESGAAGWALGGSRVKVLDSKGHVARLRVTPDGALVIGWLRNGTGRHLGWLRRVGDSGQSQWDRAIDVGKRMGELVDAAPTNAGGWLAAGRTDGWPGRRSEGFDAWLVGLDAEGQVLWQRAWGTPGDDGLLQLARRGAEIVALGRRRQVGNSAAELPWLVRLSAGASPEAPWRTTWQRVAHWRGLGVVRGMHLTSTHALVLTDAPELPLSTPEVARAAVVPVPLAGGAIVPRWRSDRPLALAPGQGEMTFVAARSPSGALVVQHRSAALDDACGCVGECDDANPCTRDRCVEGTCVADPMPDGLHCSPSAGQCTAGGRCEAGACVGAAPSLGVHDGAQAEPDGAGLSVAALPGGEALQVGWERSASGAVVASWRRLDTARATVRQGQPGSPALHRLVGVSLSRTVPGTAIAAGDGFLPDGHNDPCDTFWVTRLRWAGQGQSTPPVALSVAEGAVAVQVKDVAFMEADHHVVVGWWRDAQGDQRWFFSAVHDELATSGVVKALDVMTHKRAHGDEGRGEMVAAAYLDEERFLLAGHLEQGGKPRPTLWIHDHHGSGHGGASSSFGPFSQRVGLPELERIDALVGWSRGQHVVAGQAPTRGAGAGHELMLVAVDKQAKRLWQRRISDVRAPFVLAAHPAGGRLLLSGSSPHGMRWAHMGSDGRLLGSRALDWPAGVQIHGAAPHADGWWLVGQRGDGGVVRPYRTRLDRWGNGVCHATCIDPATRCDQGCGVGRCNPAAGSCEPASCGG